MAWEIYQTLVINQDDIPVLLYQGREEARWLEDLSQLAALLKHEDSLDKGAWTLRFNALIRAWPLSLTQLLPWGPMPHYGDLGGVTGFRM